MDCPAASRAPNVFTTAAVKPPVEIAPAISNAALATHAGHINSPFQTLPCLVRTRGLGPGLGAGANVFPAAGHSRFEIFGNEAEGGVMEHDECAAVSFAEAILHVGNDGIGHEQRADEFDKRGAFDGLYVGPEMAVAVAKVAVPPAAGPSLELQGHGLVIGSFVAGAELLEKCREGVLERGADVDFLGDVQGEVFNFRCCRDHFFSLE